jgi:hypothetical protein
MRAKKAIKPNKIINKAWKLSNKYPTIPKTEVKKLEGNSKNVVVGICIFIGRGRGY